MTRGKPHIHLLHGVAQHIFRQFRDSIAQRELREMGPSSAEWDERTERTIRTLLPRLVDLAPQVAEEIPRRLNCILTVKDLLAKPIGDQVVSILKELRMTEAPAYQEWLGMCRENAELAARMVGNLQSQQVSREIQEFIVETLSDVVYPNGGSIYPDLVMHECDYSILPKQSRMEPVEGPCLRGNRPSNVPDGCEIKTNKGTTIKVDAHGAHCGLHLGITWSLVRSRVKINGVWAAYIRKADHRESSRNVAVTTVKYSFGHSHFVSLLPK
ncbi:MAG: hypothetical protein ABIH23_22580 [bacterium]